MSESVDHLAPWVITTTHADGDTLAAGAKLRIVKARSLRTIQKSTAGWVVEAFHPPALTTVPTQMQGHPAPDVYLWDRTTVGLGPMIQQAAERRHIRVAPYTEDALYSVPILVLHHREPRTPDVALLAALRRGHDLIWSFDSVAGTAIGPRIRDSHDLQSYLRSTRAFVEDREFDRLFPDQRPCSLGSTDAPPDAIAEALALALGSNTTGLVWLLSGTDAPSTPRALSESLRTTPIQIAASDLLESPFGLMRDVEEQSFDSPLGRFHVVSCKTPAGGLNSTLEGNSGKAWSLERARTLALGEATERAAAFFANDLPVVARYDDDEPLFRFSPFGLMWDQRDPGSDTVERVEAKDIASGRLVSVPKAIVAYPFVPTRGVQRPTRGDTTGLAAFPSPDGARLRGLREVLERDVLYVNFLHQRQGFRLPSLKTDNFVFHRVWYPDCPFPSVHAFVFAADLSETPLVGRGSGSGLTWADARQSADLESLQIITQMSRGAPDHEGSAFDSWRRIDVQEALRAHLLSMPVREPPAALESKSERQQLLRIIGWLESRSQRALAVDLPSPVVDLSVVKVLVPGRVTNVHSRSGDGGAQLAGIRWQFGFPV